MLETVCSGRNKMFEDNFSVNYAKNVFLRIPIVTFGLAIIGLLIFRFNWPVFFGILLGGSVSAFNFWSQVRYVRAIIFAQTSGRYLIGSLLRLVVVAGVFILAMLYPQWLNIFAVFAGVMIAPIIIIFYKRKLPKVKGGQTK